MASYQSLSTSMSAHQQQQQPEKMTEPLLLDRRASTTSQPTHREGVASVDNSSLTVVQIASPCNIHYSSSMFTGWSRMLVYSWHYIGHHHRTADTEVTQWLRVHWTIWVTQFRDVAISECSTHTMIALVQTNDRELPEMRRNLYFRF